jgi:hypothetical protein
LITHFKPLSVHIGIYIFLSPERVLGYTSLAPLKKTKADPYLCTCAENKKRTERTNQTNFRFTSYETESHARLILIQLWATSGPNSCIKSQSTGSSFFLNQVYYCADCLFETRHAHNGAKGVSSLPMRRALFISASHPAPAPAEFV